METTFCPTCLVKTNRRIERRRESYPVRGTSIEVEADVALCVRCGTELADFELGDAALTRAYDVYRQLHGIIRPEEIRKLREEYGLSQRAFARLLDWGAITVHRYETGALPDSAHNDLLVALQDELTMTAFLQRHKDRLRPREAERALRKASAVRRIHDILPWLLEERMDAYPGTARGNRKWDLERLTQMMVFFAQPGVVLTKLLKLLWYSDFLAYRRLSVSLSGTVYRSLQFGPVPDEYRQLLDLAEREGYLRTEVEEFWTKEGLREGTVYRAATDFTPSLFQPEELEILKTVRKGFENMNANATVRASHSEEAWLATPEREVITYDWAQNLSIG
jgi:putative zinc finger/helix-turn-helix YgiT family protein